MKAVCVLSGCGDLVAMSDMVDLGMVTYGVGRL